MGFRIGPGEFIPDGPGSDGPGCLVNALVIALVVAMAASYIGRSGAAEPGRINYVASQSLCAATEAGHQAYAAAARQAFDSGEPDAPETAQRVATATGGRLLARGTEVLVRRTGTDSLTLVALTTGDRPRECWVATSELKMGWGEWLSWRLSRRRQQEATEKERAAAAARVKRRLASSPPHIVACSTGRLTLAYRGTDVESAIPVSFERCLSRGGRVEFSGVDGGLVYFPNGASSTNFNLNEPLLLFAGPRGSDASVSCVCDDTKARPNGAEQRMAPAEYVDRGACPFEGCSYGERWLAREDVQLYTAPPDSAASAVSALVPSFAVRAGTWVTTESGLVLSRRQNGRANGRTHDASGADSGPGARAFAAGTTVPVYTYLGEGCWRAWVAGAFPVVCDLDVDGRSENNWWVRVRLSDGRGAWTSNTRGFVSQEGLNSDLASLIEDATIPLPDKLRQIDTLLQQGADLNGNGVAFSGLDPATAVRQIHDPELLKALIARGLSAPKR